ncbi:alpha/beta hydrolase [Pedococcus cremeus]|uniref:alpha/beta hydrolase n=1 Tax=Pedococcus cremeus TaxID=587636 RepID=UPI001C4343C6|nr:alpha/beta hydrolase [Pedococcus cremeus]
MVQQAEGDAYLEVAARALSADGCTRATPAVHGIESIVTATSTASQPTPHRKDRQSAGDGPGGRGRIAWIVLGSFAAGWLVALLLALAPFVAADVPRVTGALLCGYAVGWAMLAALSVRLTDQPQRWAWALTAFMGVGGVLLLSFGSSVMGALAWVWPPVLLALAVWSWVQARRHLHSRTRPLLVYPLLFVLALASVGGAYQVLGARTDAKAHPMPGQLDDVGGRSLHLRCTGSGTPTVLLQPGAGEFSSNMGWIAPAVAEQTRVCVYDRAGRGWSDPADAPQDGAALVADLHMLLARAHVTGPYVVAGHSFGGLYTLAFAAKYPDEVAGMVLLDSTNPKPATKPTKPTTPGSYDPLSHLSAVAATIGEVGLTRLYSHVEAGTLPPRSRDEIRASIAHPDTVKSTIDEYVQSNKAMQQAAELTDFGAKPLVVVTAGEGSAPDWSAKQDRLAALSTNSAHRTVAGAAHEDLVAKSSDAAQSSKAIMDVVSAVRGEAQLAK